MGTWRGWSEWTDKSDAPVEYRAAASGHHMEVRMTKDPSWWSDSTQGGMSGTKAAVFSDGTAPYRDWMVALKESGIAEADVIRIQVVAGDQAKFGGMVHAATMHMLTAFDGMPDCKPAAWNVATDEVAPYMAEMAASMGWEK